MATPTTVDEYLAELPEARRAAVEQLRQTINAAAPEATESIAYQMPALRSHGGQFLVSYAAFKNHYSLFPASDVVVATLGDGADAVPGRQGHDPLPGEPADPADLVRRIVEIRVTENAARRTALGDGPT